MPGSTAVVIGIGGLGHMAIQMLVALTTARIIAVDPRAEARSSRRTCGRRCRGGAGSGRGEERREKTPRGAGAAVVLDFVGARPTLAVAAATARTVGDLTLVGLAGGTVPLSFFSVPTR